MPFISSIIPLCLCRQQIKSRRSNSQIKGYFWKPHPNTHLCVRWLVKNTDKLAQPVPSTAFNLIKIFGWPSNAILINIPCERGLCMQQNRTYVFQLGLYRKIFISSISGYHQVAGNIWFLQSGKPKHTCLYAQTQTQTCGGICNCLCVHVGVCVCVCNFRFRLIPHD